MVTPFNIRREKGNETIPCLRLIKNYNRHIIKAREESKTINEQGRLKKAFRGRNALFDQGNFGTTGILSYIELKGLNEVL